MGIKKQLQRFRQSRTAIVPVLAIAACTLIFIPVIYWILSVTLDDVYTSMTAVTALTGNALSAWLLVKGIISVLMGIVIFIVLLWVLVNAKASSYEQ